MEYTGKLYGKIGNKYFDTGFTSEDYDKLQKENSELQKQVLNLHVVSSWVLCAERQPEEEGMYLVKNKYELTGEYHKYGKWAGKWTVDDTDGYEIEIDVSEWKVI